MLGGSHSRLTPGSFRGADETSGCHCALGVWSSSRRSMRRSNVPTLTAGSTRSSPAASTYFDSARLTGTAAAGLDMLRHVVRAP